MAKRIKSISAARHLTVIFLLTLCLAGMLVFTYLQGTHISAIQAPLTNAASKIKLEATLAHLKFEEILSGDVAHRPEIVWRHLDASTWYAQAMLDGGNNDEGNYVPIEDAALRQDIRDILVQLKTFRDIAEQRLLDGRDSRYDTERFDGSYQTLMSEADDVERDLRHAMRQELNDFQHLEITLIFLCVFSGSFVAWELRSFIGQINADVNEIRNAQQELEKSNHDLASFAYIASHDLREPLRKIQAFGDRLLDRESDNLSARGKDYAQRMQKSASRMQDLIEALLNYSRIGTRGEEFTPTDLNKVMQEAMEDLNLRIRETGCVVKADKLPEIDADSIQMRQVFQNLIANAIKFRRQGVPPRIEISARVHARHCSLVFRDNGIGFEPEYAERIFGVFQRLHGRDAYEGAGIGLSICQKTIERHGGSIVAEGMLGEGAVFTISLPLRQRDAGEGRHA